MDHGSSIEQGVELINRVSKEPDYLLAAHLIVADQLIQYAVSYFFNQKKI